MTDQVWTLRHELAVLGSGVALPGAPVSTDALVAMIEQRFGFARCKQALAIARRLDIRSRHVSRAFEARHEDALPGRTNPDLAAKAVQAALDDAGLAIGDLGYLIGHTTTPEQLLPPNIALVADRLGYRGPFVELRQACTGFANALMIACGLLADAGSAPVAIVGSETGSLFFDPGSLDDEAGQIVNLIQMGDGAGAVILGPRRSTGDAIVAGWFGAAGLGREPGIQLKSGATEFDHDFAAVAAHGPALFEAGAQVLARLGYPLAGCDWIVPHQVSGKIGALAADHFTLPPERFFGNAAHIGNTGSAAIWIALSELRQRGLAPAATLATLGAEASKFMHGGFVYRHG
ncbi:3-oxoacyl-ACP synthase III family protein [Novosphingobium lentum]|uniref:3-oxoacyl-ACP synthase III family protein n=1 Tax=Novosphingobium lentum TaxID=145287 RepID=UPI00082E21DF|nr:3-oxoacyl-[acyl-carrier-protein] synthase III C-terminal domain-containing protein [Novosphingobium lentum]